MALTLVATTTANRDLTSTVQVLNNTPDASNPRWCQIHCEVGGDSTNQLDGSGGDFEYALYIGGRIYGGNFHTRTTMEATTLTIQTPPFIVPANDAVTFYILSPNPADTSVSVAATIYDIPAGDVREINGDTSAAENLESDYDGTGYFKTNSLIGACSTNGDMVSEPLDAAGIRSAVGLASANLDTQLAAIVADTNELQTDDLPGLIAALNDVSTADVQTAAAAALTAYDPPTNTELEARTLAAASYATAANQTTILGYVDCLPATLDGATLTAIPWNAAWDAEVQSEVVDGLTAYGASTHDADDVVTALDTGSTLTDCLTATGFSTFDPATDEVQLVDGAITGPKIGTDALGSSKFADTFYARIDTELTSTHGEGSWAGSVAGDGALPLVITVQEADSDPISGVQVHVTSDAAGATRVAGPLTTGTDGSVTFMLDAGTYYVWRYTSGYSFTTNPQTVTVS